MQRFLLAALLLVSCDARIQKPPIPVSNPDYLVLRPLLTTAAADSVAATLDGNAMYYRPSECILDLRQLDLRTAQVQKGSGPVRQYGIWIRTTDDGAKRLGTWTAAHVHQQLGIFVDGRLLAAPTVTSEIREMVVVAGLDQGQAETIARRLRRGGAE